MKNRLEKYIQKDILKYLRANNIYCWPNKTQGTYNPTLKRFMAGHTFKGPSDVLGILDTGQFLAIEVKSKTGKLSPEQKDFLQNINQRGGVAFMCRSLEECIELIGPHIRKWDSEVV